jgi:CheY-like chemotaxis protein
MDADTPALPKALIVDDEPAIRELYAEVLRQMGFHVDVAENGAVGLDRLRASFYSVIISDLRMPVVSGYEFWERSDGTRPGSGRRFILTTGFVDFLDTKEYDLVSGKTCITKPATIEEIQGAVAGLIREIGIGPG